MASNLTLCAVLVLVVCGVLVWARSKFRATVGVATTEADVRAALLIADAEALRNGGTDPHTTPSSLATPAVSEGYVGKHRAEPATKRVNPDPWPVTPILDAPGSEVSAEDINPRAEVEALPSPGGLEADLRAFYGR